MDEQGSTKFIDPRIQEVQNTTTNIYNKAMDEFGFKMPLAFALYNQIRYYEDFGKLKIGYSIVGKKALADQFGVSVKQIESAYNNLTNKYKLGSWIMSDAPIFRNVTRVWASNVRQRRMSLEDTLELANNYYSVIVNGQKLLQRNSKTITAEYLLPEVRPLSESNIKVNNNISKNIDNAMVDMLFTIGLDFNQQLSRDRRVQLLKSTNLDSVTPQQLRDASVDYRDSNMSSKSVENFLKPKVLRIFLSKHLLKSQLERLGWDE